MEHNQHDDEWSRREGELSELQTSSSEDELSVNDEDEENTNKIGKGQLVSMLMKERAQEAEQRHKDWVEKSDKDKAMFADLLLACRTGDVEKVDNLVTGYGVDVNLVDEWDATPLFLASLCGHESVVKYLLVHGAICDRDTFQGERALYAALTDNIRSLLLKHGISKSIDTVQPFAAHISSLLTRNEPKTSDIQLIIPGDIPQEITVHRFILIARSSYFRNLLLTESPKEISSLTLDSNLFDAESFSLVIKHIYLTNFIRPSQDLAIRTIEIANKIDLASLSEYLKEAACQDNPNVERLNSLRRENTNTAQGNFEVFFNEYILEKRATYSRSLIGSVTESNIIKELSETNGVGADILIRFRLDSQEEEEEEEEEESYSESESEDEVYLYPVHRAMLIRSPYFQAMFTSPFAEARAYNNSDQLLKLPVVDAAVINRQVGEIMLSFLYTDRAEIPLDLAVDLLYTGEYYLLDRLKSMAAVSITNTKDKPDILNNLPIYDILRAAWSTRSDRLEKFVAEIIANHFDNFINEAEFSDVVLESASRILEIQETDTIELIDDIRFFLAKKYNITFARALADYYTEGQGPQQHLDAIKNKLKSKDKSSAFSVDKGDEMTFNRRLDQIDDLLQRLHLEA